MKRYQVELVNLNERDEITCSWIYSLDREEVIFNTLEEAIEVAESLVESRRNNDIDSVIVNELTIEKDEYGDEEVVNCEWSAEFKIEK